MVHRDALLPVPLCCHGCTLRAQPVSWGAPTALCAPARHGAALAGPTLLRWGALGRLRLMLCAQLPGRCSEGVRGPWRRAARGVGSQACSWARPLPALCMGQGLLEKQPQKAGVNSILDGHSRGLPVVPAGLRAANPAEQTWGMGSGSGPCGQTHGAGRGCTARGRSCGVVAGRV